MVSYMDLVICTHDGSDKPYIFRAPAWTHLKKGDRVIVETQNGEAEMTVERSYPVESNGDELEFILMVSGATLPLRKVLKKVEYKDFKYKEDDNE